MAKIKVRGGEEYSLPYEEAKKLMVMRWGDPQENIEPKDKKMMIKVEDDRFELGLIHMISLKNEHSLQMYDRSHLKEVSEEVKQREERMKHWDSVTKAHRIIKTFCYVLYKTKLNEGEIVDPLYSELMDVIFDYFEKNPGEIHCPKEVYMDLIPRKGAKVVGIPGFNSFAQCASGQKEEVKTEEMQEENFEEDLNISV